MELPRHSTETAGAAPGYTDAAAVYEPVQTVGNASDEITNPLVPAEEPTANTPAAAPRYYTFERPNPLLPFSNALDLTIVSDRHNDTPGNIALWRKGVEQGMIRGMLPFDGEDAKTPYELKVFGDVIPVIGAIAADAGVEVRLPPETIHVFPDDASYSAAYAEAAPGKAAGSLPYVVTSPDRGMLINRRLYEHYVRQHPEELYRITLHEGGHLAEKTSVFVGDDRYDRAGVYGSPAILYPPDRLPPAMQTIEPDDGRALREAIAEMAAFNGMRRLGKDDQLNCRRGYWHLAFGLEAIVLDTAQYQDEPPAEIENGLYRAAFGGDITTLHKIAAAIGDERSRVLWTMPYCTSSPKQLIAAYDALSAGRSDDRIWNNAWLMHEDGLMPPLFAWQQGASLEPKPLLPDPTPYTAGA